MASCIQNAKDSITLTKRYRRYITPLLIILTISFAVYANTLNNGFVYDDERMIVNNPFIKDLIYLPKLFTGDYFLVSLEISYRPIVTLTYFLDYALYGLKPLGFHLTNIIIHSVNGVMLYIYTTLLIQSLSISRGIVIYRFLGDKPLLISILFVIHPVLTEAVNGISYREDLLAFFFYIGTLTTYLFLKSKPDRSSLRVILYIVSCLLYFLALLSKEMAATLPLIIYCYEWINKNKKTSLSSTIPNKYNVGFILITLAYLYLRFFYFYNPLEGERPVLPLSERILTIPYLLLSYIKLAILPVSLSAEYLLPLVPLFSIYFIMPFLSLIVIVILFLFMAKEKEIAFGACFFFISLSPLYNIIPTANPLAERALYLPMVGFVIIIGSIAYRILKKWQPYNFYVIIPLIIILGLYSFILVNRNTIWRDNISLWSDTTRKMPKSSRIRYSFGTAYLSQGKLEDAKREFQTAIELSPNYLEAHMNLGVVYYKQGRPDEAIREFETALTIKPDHANALNNMALIYAESRRLNEALKLYQDAINLNQGLIESHYGIALVYLKMDLENMAGIELETTLRLNPNHLQARRMLEKLNSNRISHTRTTIGY